jgi:hypothetical protein
MVSCLGGGDLIRTLTQHELKGVHREEAPSFGVYRVELKAKNLNIESRRSAQILNRQYTAGTKHARHFVPPKFSQLTIEFTGRGRMPFKHRRTKLVVKRAVPRSGAMSLATLWKRVPL